MKVVPLSETIPAISKAYLYGVIMTSLHVAIKWSHKESRYFLINIDIYLSDEIVLYTGKTGSLLGPN